MSLLKATMAVKSTNFSDFLRNASSPKKRRVYGDLMKKSTERQRKVLAAASSLVEIASAVDDVHFSVMAQ